MPVTAAFESSIITDSDVIFGSQAKAVSRCYLQLTKVTASAISD
jgi:hypothetical protein